MKRAKIALTVIAMFAVVGGALAFKSYRGVNTYCRATSLGTGVCTTTYFATSLTTTNIAGTLYCTTLPGSPSTMCTNTVRTITLVPAQP